MEESSYLDQLAKLFEFACVREAWTMTKSAWNTYNVYLIYKGRFLPLGPSDLIVSLSPNELLDKVEQARYEFDRVGMPYPHYSSPHLSQAPTEPPEITLRHLQARIDASPPPVASRQYPLARLSIPQAVLQQILQLPDSYDIKHIAIEDGVLCVYCLTPETAELSPKDVIGQPTMTADYQLDSRNSESWRRLMNVHVDIAYVDGRTT